MSATILVQQLDANNDPIESGDGPVFLADIDAVAQIIGTRIKLLMGEWWEDLSLGFPLFQNLIGTSGSAANQAAVLLTLQQTILACPFVLQLVSFSLIGNTATRATGFTATVATAFGTVVVTNSPGINAQVNP
jgi:hypothetical protein